MSSTHKSIRYINKVHHINNDPNMSFALPQKSV